MDLDKLYRKALALHKSEQELRAQIRADLAGGHTYRLKSGKHLGLREVKVREYKVRAHTRMVLTTRIGD